MIIPALRGLREARACFFEQFWWHVELCSCCNAIVQVPAQSQPIERGFAGPGLLASWVTAASALLRPPVDAIRRHAPPADWFAYTPDRKGIHPQFRLAHFEGVLQADA